MPELEQFNPHKILCHYNKVCDLLNGKDIYPVTVEINPTNKCNHKCVWCTYGYLKDCTCENDTIEKDLLLRIVAQIGELDTKGLIWTGGGEPLVNKATFDGMKLAAQKGLQQAIHTNGSLVKGRVSDFIVDNFTYIRISLDAGSEQTHMRLHKAPRGDFDRILSNLENLVGLKEKRNSDLTIGVSVLLHPDNCHEVEDVVEIAKRLRVDYLQFKPIVIWGLKEQLPTNYIERSFEVIDEISRLEVNNGLSIRVLNYKFADMINDQGRFGRHYSKCCGHPFVGSICANASVDLCCSFKGVPEWSFGNLREQSFKEIWASQRRQQVIKQINLSKCEPLCRLHEINKILDYMKNYEYHKNFV